MKKVSLLTPFYNVEGYIHRLLQSVVEQTYPLVEMILVDDGSTDGSLAVAESFAPRFAERGYDFRIIHQANTGQSGAVKHGLQYVTGDYLVWPDADDYYATPEALSRLATALDQAPSEVAMVRAPYYFIEDGTQKILRRDGHDEHYTPEEMLRNCIYGPMTPNFWYCSGAYMIDFHIFREETNLDICTSRHAGQNLQLLLPILCGHQCLTLDEPIYYVTERPTSHSRGQYQKPQELFDKSLAFESVLIGTLFKLNHMTDQDKLKYTIDLHRLYATQRLHKACQSKDPQLIDRAMSDMKAIGHDTWGRRAKALLAKTSWGASILHLLRRI